MSEKGGGTLLSFSIPAVHASFGRKAIAGEHGKNTIPPNDAPNPPTMHTCRAVTASEHLLIGSRTAPHPDVRDEGSLESVSPALTPAAHWAPPTYLRPGRLPARISVTRPCSVGTSHTPHKPEILYLWCQPFKNARKSKNLPGHLFNHDDCLPQHFQKLSSRREDEFHHATLAKATR